MIWDGIRAGLGDLEMIWGGGAGEVELELNWDGDGGDLGDLEMSWDGLELIWDAAVLGE